MVFKITRARKAPEKKIPKAQLSVWDRGLEDLLANIEVSITEATGRYHTEEGAYAKPKASKCWRVKSVTPPLITDLLSRGLRRHH